MDNLADKDIVNLCLDSGLLLDPDMLGIVDKRKLSEVLELKNTPITKNAVLISKLSFENMLNSNQPNINWLEFEKAKTLSQKGKNNDLYEGFVDFLSSKAPSPGCIKDLSGETDISVIAQYKDRAQKKDLTSFVNHINNRYRRLVQMLKGRQELQNLVSIRRARQMPEKEAVSTVGMVLEKNITKNNNIILTLEDPSGRINALISKNNDALFTQAKEICYDEVIGVTGHTGNQGIIYINSVVWPDIPLNKELKKSPVDEYAVFISDIHVGSNAFLEKQFLNFIMWLKGELGTTKQRDVASKVKYLFIVGDLVEGVGIYPGQEEELLINDVIEQYAYLAKFLSLIPSTIKIIVCPGNHDALRIAEPQPPLDNEFAYPILNLPNIVSVSNPCTLNMGKKHNFNGFEVLLYHGYSFIYYADKIESIRLAGGLKKVDLISRYLLKRRHLAPAHGSTLYVPHQDTDPLVIERLPDFFVSGHVHRATYELYKNISILNCSCWVSQTKYQEKVGLKPQPGRAAIVNLKTQHTSFLKFYEE